MCSYDIKSLFTNVPLEETIQICTKELYHCDIERPPPPLSEKSFIKLIRKVTTGVEFTFDDIMYRQIDGVAMGSPLGPVLANIFVGFQEERLNIDDRPDVLLYHQYVDDTFALEIEKDDEDLLTELNNLHPSLQFTCAKEEGNKLPVLDVHVQKALSTEGEDVCTVFETTIYRKPTFTGLLGYTHVGTLSQTKDTKRTLSGAS